MGQREPVQAPRTLGLVPSAGSVQRFAVWKGGVCLWECGSQVLGLRKLRVSLRMGARGKGKGKPLTWKVWVNQNDDA